MSRWHQSIRLRRFKIAREKRCYFTTPSDNSGNTSMGYIKSFRYVPDVSIALDIALDIAVSKIFKVTYQVSFWHSTITITSIRSFIQEIPIDLPALGISRIRNPRSELSRSLPLSTRRSIDLVVSCPLSRAAIDNIFKHIESLILHSSSRES